MLLHADACCCCCFGAVVAIVTVAVDSVDTDIVVACCRYSTSVIADVAFDVIVVAVDVADVGVVIAVMLLYRFCYMLLLR